MNDDLSTLWDAYCLSGSEETAAPAIGDVL
jgi:hypothetical protein